MFCSHIAHISFASSWYLFCLSVIVLARLCVFGTAMSIRRVFFVFLLMNVISGRLKHCFVRKYAAVPVQLEIIILQYNGWFVLIIRGFFFNQLSYLYYYYYYVVVVVSCHMPFLPGTFEPTVIRTAQASSFTLQYFPYYV